ncbi:MAG: filamentous hemagglutinin N-terminal domain-containing protein, partial [Cyanobacteria bacterium P01_C01_bin.38]
MRDRNLLFFDRKRCILMGLSVTLSFAPFLQAKAQLIPDNTLGKEKSIVNSSELLQRIDGGAIRGSNLFHSFKEFNIDSGKSVYFNNPGAIENILTRVTGKNPSNIFGKLGVLGNANLFLLNPNGIVFGKGASLDIPGSFNASTSPGILFDNSFEFSATNPSSVPLLKVNLTPGLQYPRSQQGDISNQGSLTVGKDLNFLGKNIDLNGSLNSGRDLTLKASDTLQIRDNLNNPFIVNAGRDLLLQANQTIDIFALNHSDSGLFSGNDLILQSANPVFGDARYFSGGNFRIEKLDGNLGDLESPKDPIIRASGDVSFDSYRGASLHILAGGSVDITGNVTITGADGENGLQETVTLSNG